MSTEQGQSKSTPIASKVIIGLLIAGTSYVAWERLKPIPVECDVNGFIIDDSKSDYFSENVALMARRSEVGIGQAVGDRASLARAPSCERTALNRENKRFSSR